MANSKGIANNEISFKDLFLRLKEMRRHLFSKWHVVLAWVFLFACLGGVYSIFKKKIYVSNLTFVVEESKSLGGYAGLASQFGIDLGVSSESGVFSGDNVMEFLKSKLLVEETLLTDTIWNGKKTTLGDIYIDIYGLKKKGAESDVFEPNDQLFTLSRRKDSVLQALHKIIIKKNLEVDKPDKSLGFIQVSTRTTDEIFSKLFTERLVRAALNFYIATTTQNAQVNVNRLQSQADSVLEVLNKKTLSAARIEDLDLNPARRITTVNSEMEGRDKTILLTIYGEIIKNLEMAKMTLAQKTPVIQVVDVPMLPLPFEKPSLLVCIIGGGLIGGFVSAGYLVSKKAYVDIMQ